MASPAPQDPKQVDDKGWPLIAFGVAAILTVLPILMHLHLPLVDLPNHIARHVILATKSGPLLEYYSISADLVPNSSVDLIWVMLGFPTDAERFSQLMMAFYAASMIASTMILSRTVLGRWSVWPAVSGLLVFSGPFFWGFQNFLITVPFAIVGLALWLRLQRSPVLVRLGVFFPFAAVLCLMHFFAFLVLAIAAFGREAQIVITARHGRGRALGVANLMALPFLFPIFGLLYLTLTGPASVAGSTTQFSWIEFKADLLTAVFAATNADVMPAVNLVGIVGFLGLTLCLLTLFRRKGARLAFSPVMAGPVLAMAVATLLSPTWLNGVALVHIRLPYILLLLLLASTSWRDVSVPLSRMLVAVFLVILTLRGLTFERFAAYHDADIRQLVSVLQDLQAGSRLLPLRAEGEQHDVRLSHAQAYAIIARGAFIPTLFQGAHAISLKEKWKEHADPVQSALEECHALPDLCAPKDESPVYMTNWRQKFTHVLLLDQNPSFLNSQPDLIPISQQGRFTLYRIVPQANQ